MTDTSREIGESVGSSSLADLPFLPSGKPAISDRQKHWLSSLLRTTQVASSTLSMDEVLATVACEVTDVTGADACNSFLFPERSKFGNYYIIDPLPPRDYHVPDPPDSFTMEALRTVRPVIAQDVMTHPLTDKRTMRYFGIYSALAFPLVYQGEAVAAGFLSFHAPHEFSAEEIEMVMAIASAGAMAISNVKLHETLVQLAVVQERNRIAQELHDSVCQTLATIKVNLSILPYLSDLTSQAKDTINGTKTLVDKTYAEVREIIRAFRAAGVSPAKQVESLADYVREFGEANNICVTEELPGEVLGLLNQNATLQLGRIIGEALANVRRHSLAKSVSVRGHQGESSVIVEIEDDGVGFDIDKLATQPGRHFGLAIMRERAQAVGGLLEVEQTSPHGTIIRVTIPYR